MKRILWLRCILLVALALVVAGAGTQGALALVRTPDSGDATDIMMDLESESGISIVEAASSDDTSQGSIPTEILVKFKAGVALDTIDEMVQRNGDMLLDSIPEIGAHLIQVPAGEVGGRLAAYGSSALVEYAEPNSATEAIYFPYSAPNDTYFIEQWALERMMAQEAWKVTQSRSDVVIAILDTGIDQDHPDLAGKIIVNRNFTTSSTVDDLDGHGTQVAGVAAAVTNNGTGVAGLACQARLMNIKVMGDEGTGSVGAAVNGILWATNGPDGNPYTDDGADVINMSFVTGVPSPSLQQALAYAWEHGVVMVGGAGNYGNTEPCYPARYPKCIAVAASSLNADNSLVYFSTRGEWVEVAAPGTSIWTTARDGSYKRGVGTSIASPNVAGLAALVVTTVRDVNGNGLINDEVKYAIESTCTGLGPDVRYGVVNAYRAVTASVPSLGFISGLVTDAVTGEPVYPTYGAIVTDGTREAFTESDGRYKMYGVPAGTYTVTVSALGYLNQSRTVTVYAGRTSTANFALATSAGGAIAGVVRNSGYSPVSGATVTDGTRYATTAADGSYIIRNVPEGHFTVSASAPGYLPTSMAVIVYRGQSTTKDFVLFADSSAGPEASFWATPLSGAAPLSVVFTDRSTSGSTILSWFWNFGDGTTSTVRNPSHTYTRTGTYNVSLTIRDSKGISDTETKTNYITVSNASLEADFSAAPSSGYEPLTVLFTDGSTSGGSIVSWFWNFGDGATSTLRNPSHVYVANGVYTVSLTVRDSSGSSRTETKAGCITVVDTSPTADFSAAPVSGLQPLSIACTDGSTSYDGIVSWRWGFGDGSYSYQRNPVHTYSRAGTYVVSLVVTDRDGSTDAASQSIQAGVPTITVAVTAGGTPMEGCRVYAFTSEGVYAGYSIVTDAQGKAVFTLSPGYYKFRVYYDGGYWWSPVVSTGSSTYVSLPAYTIARVTVDGVPLEGYRVYAYTATGTYAGYSQLTDGFGDAAFTLAAGSYKFRVFYDGTTWWSPVVTAPATTTIRIDQDPLADTEVKVTLDGAPLEGYRVYAYDNAGTYTGQSEVTDAQGRALFSLPTGTYKFKSYYSGSWHWSPLVTTPATTSIDIVSDTVSDTVVKVTVDGSPLRSYRVYAYNPQGAYVGKSEVTNTSGEAVFALSGGQYKFKSYYGGSWYWSPLVTTPTRTAITIVTQTFPDSVTDTVVTVTAGGYALQGYRVYGYNPEGTYTGRSELTDASGRAVFSLAEGSYKFKVYYAGAWHWSSVVSTPASVYIRM